MCVKLGQVLGWAFEIAVATEQALSGCGVIGSEVRKFGGCRTGIVDTERLRFRESDD